MSVHVDRDRNGHVFGAVTITVDDALGDCVMYAPIPLPTGQTMRRTHLHGWDEIAGARMAAVSRLNANPGDQVARDMEAALRFAMAMLRPKWGNG